jgi:hypothetical protein
MHVELDDARLTLPGAEQRSLAHYLLIAAGDVVTAHAGASDAKYYGDTAFSPDRVPKPRHLPERERALADLYERAQSAHKHAEPVMTETFARVHTELQQDFPKEWLLRWNLLESLLKRKGPAASATAALAAALHAELEELEVRFDHREPIASGLGYLSRMVA